MSIKSKLAELFSSNKQPMFKMITTDYNGFYSYDGRLYQSDIVRACIRPYATAVGKLVAKHIRESIKIGVKSVAVNPEVYIKFLLKEPNPFMTGQDLQEKMATQLKLNGNTFALIVRDASGLPEQIYPLNAESVEPKVIDGVFCMRFMIKGRFYTFKYSDIIHIRMDFNDNLVFGTSPADALKELMEVLTIMDQGIVKAIKNSGAVRWLLKFLTGLKPGDVKSKTKDFVNTYLSTETETFGAAGIDNKMEAERIEPKDYVPNAGIIDRTTKRIYSFFNTNEKIVMSTATEDEWNAYYEQEIEPIAIKLSNEFTRKLFTRKQQGFGNYIYFEASSLAHASISTKLQLVAMVDRGALTPNEWRDAFNWAPLPDGDEAIRRLDTKEVNQGGKEE